MSRVLTVSQKFPSYHPKAGESTFFVEKILNGIATKMHSGVVDLNLLPDEVKNIVNDFVLLCSPEDIKGHTIRAGNRWKVGDLFSPRVWGNDINTKSGRSGPYHSKQIIIAPDIQVKKVWKFEITPTGSECAVYIDNTSQNMEILNMVSKNDGLTRQDFNYWFSSKNIRDNGFTGQIICWNENINY
jgi:hypothetical protein